MSAYVRRAGALAVVRLRSATEWDVPAIAVFHTQCWREAYRGLVPQEYLDGVTAADREPRWRRRLVSGARQIVVAVWFRVSPRRTFRRPAEYRLVRAMRSA